jgi:tetratricopeptide (TPR) repeat protein
MGQLKWPEAQELLRQAVDKAPWLAELHQNLGACFANQGLYALAEAELDEALLQDPQLGWARYNRAGLYVTARADTTAALAELRMLMELELDTELRGLAADFLARLIRRDADSSGQGEFS